MNENAKYYDEKAKLRTMKYRQAHSERITVWVNKGEKEKYKVYAESKGKSLNALIVELLENNMKSNI